MIKSVEFISHLEAESRPATPNTGIISITDPDFPDAWLDDWDPILRLKFHDLDKPWQNYELMSEAQADEIIEWLKKYEDKIDSVIVHCWAGASRSAGVAKFIAKRYNLTFDEDYRYYNKHVYNLLVHRGRDV